MLAVSFVPTADSGLGYDDTNIPPPLQPQTIGPIFDSVSSTEPLASFDTKLHEQSYAPGRFENGTSKMPPKPDDFSDPYLYPMLTSNERLRLTMLWYYSRGLADDDEILRNVRAKVELLKSLIGWEFAICGLLENDIYKRLATAGLPLAILPRRESTCSHTVHQAAGSVFFIPDMSSDWRFALSPHVCHGGIRTYAGAPLRYRVDGDQDIALGSLCIASNSPHQKLSQFQMDMLVQFADMVTEDIVNGSRRKRAKQQEQNHVLLRQAFAESLHNPTDEKIMTTLRQVYPDVQIDLLPINDHSVQLHAGSPSIILPELDVKSATWEDSDLIDELLRTNNHQRLRAAQPIRAIIGIVPDNPTNKALVVSTTDIAHIFDDVDVRFIEGCAMILRSIAQERSLQDALNTRERFMRGITHQLRTPIHGILGSADLLADEIARVGQRESDVVTENLKMIKSSGRELMSTVNNVIKFNRWTESIGTSRLVTLAQVDKLELEILEDVSCLLPEGRLDQVSVLFNNRVPANVSVVQFDMTLLKDCLQSLILNALQNTIVGSVVITTSTTPDYSSIIFDVQDTGCGIESVDQHRIFDAYEKGNAHSSGAGLGLTLARKIATFLNGTVTLVSSVLGKGSHFRAEFRSPNFACPKENTGAKVAIPEMISLPGRFAFVSSSVTSALDEHFAHYLKARGLQQSEDASGALVIIPFAQSFDQHQELLRLDAKPIAIISLAPTGADLSKARKAHPETFFFSGPFTSDRLHEILAGMRDTLLSRKPLLPLPPPPKQTSPEDDGKVQPVPGTDVLPIRISSRRSSIAPSASTPNCLLVDDNRINLRIMTMYCDKRKLPYVTAVDGLQAIDEYKRAVKETPINLILLDLQMPHCDGIQACEQIRAYEAKETLSPAVIFIITGQDSPSDRAKSLAAGADKFFVKPLSLKNLDRGIAERFVQGA